MKVICKYCRIAIKATHLEHANKTTWVNDEYDITNDDRYFYCFPLDLLTDFNWESQYYLKHQPFDALEYLAMEVRECPESEQD